MRKQQKTRQQHEWVPTATFSIGVSVPLPPPPFPHGQKKGTKEKDKAMVKNKEKKGCHKKSCTRGVRMKRGEETPKIREKPPFTSSTNLCKNQNDLRQSIINSAYLLQSDVFSQPKEKQEIVNYSVPVGATVCLTLRITRHDIVSLPLGITYCTISMRVIVNVNVNDSGGVVNFATLAIRKFATNQEAVQHAVHFGLVRAGS